MFMLILVLIFCFFVLIHNFKKKNMINCNNIRKYNSKLNDLIMLLYVISNLIFTLQNHFQRQQWTKEGIILNLRKQDKIN